VPKVIVPVGFENGSRWSGKQVAHEVMFPNAAATLPTDAHAVWLAAFTDVDAQASLRFTRDQLLEFSERLGIVGANEIIGHLHAAGLLVEFDPTVPGELFERYRLYPLAEGLGNTEENPTVFQIAREGRVLLQVNVHVFGVWSTSVYFSSLAEGIAKYAAAVDVPAVEIGRRFALALPAIVANRCGFLQPA
jgi:hypothetical protein